MIEKFVTYFRVSSKAQGQSGLGLDAQRLSVDVYLRGRASARVLAEFTEIETGTDKRERPKLAEALAHCARTGAALVVANVSRLTRSVGFLHRLLESGVIVTFCDLPQVEGPQGRFLLTSMAAVAELEAGLISARTKSALAAAKLRGTKLGNPNGARALLRDRERNQRIGTAAVKAKAVAFAERLRPVIAELRQAGGWTSLVSLADYLNATGVRTPRGGLWHPTSVQRLLNRLDAGAGR